MSFIDTVREDHGDLARVLKKHAGIRRTVEELYPDSAHFIYELLQNAEDTGATEAFFELRDSSLVFEHNGRPFSEADVRSITDIGDGTKSEDLDKIGRFGVGFKAVFAYTETPRIWSPSFCFEITDLVLPGEIPAIPSLGDSTRFEFPFNNPKKSPHVAHSQVVEGLNGLAETTLLFLTHLKSISWRVGRESQTIRRIPHAGAHFEILGTVDNKIASSRHYLRFSRPVEGLENQKVAIAFELENLPDVSTFQHSLPLHTQMRIKSAFRGRVSVYFPAEKETSGLRFHVHAPFVTGLDRASIKDSNANSPLFLQLAQLSASALDEVRNLGLLTRDFLAVLPNPQDGIQESFKPIMRRIIAAMRERPLTPTQLGAHAEAKVLLQSSSAMKELLSADDLALLLNAHHPRPQWAISAAQRNSNADRFLAALEITRWGVDDLIKVFTRVSTGISWVSETDPRIERWMASKLPEWYQQLYSLLSNELSDAKQAAKLEIILLADGTFSAGARAYFPSETVKHDSLLPRVDEAVFTSGKSKPQQVASRRFLKAVGVREVSEAEQLKAILRQRYSEDAEIPDETTYLTDLDYFITFLEENPGSEAVFGGYYLFKVIRRDDDEPNWVPPDRAYLDAPLCSTGLSLFLRNDDSEGSKRLLAADYERYRLPKDRLVNFARKVGVQDKLEAVKTTCERNPMWDYLLNVGGVRPTSPVNEDYAIPGLRKTLKEPTLEIARMIWKLLKQTQERPELLQARYRKTQSHGYRFADSHLIHILRETAWVPQREGGFVKPAAADERMLPRGFSIDPDDEWLDKIKFGVECQKREEELAQRRQVALELGFKDEESLSRARKFNALPKEEQENLLAEFENRQRRRFPEHETTNRERRDQRLSEQAAQAPERIVEERMRSVSVGRESVKREADPYLRGLYTDEDGDLVCQICGEPMPFRLSDGQYYMEMVEFLKQLERRHRENYLALCPNHAAMFEHANDSKSHLIEMFKSLESTALDVVLAGQPTIVRFTQTHIDDLKQIIRVDESPRQAS